MKTCPPKRIRPFLSNPLLPRAFGGKGAEGMKKEIPSNKQVHRTPAELDLVGLPEGFGFQIELKVTDTTENKSKPVIESLRMDFDPS